MTYINAERAEIIDSLRKSAKSNKNIALLLNGINQCLDLQNESIVRWNNEENNEQDCFIFLELAQIAACFAELDQVKEVKSHG